MTFLQAIVIGIIQGVGRAVPDLEPRPHRHHPGLHRRARGLASSPSRRRPSPPYLAFVVGPPRGHRPRVDPYFWSDWLRILQGFFSSVRKRRAETADQRAAWFVVVATIPVGRPWASVLEHQLRTIFAKPSPRPTS